MNAPPVVRDDKGHEYSLRPRPLGAGGQGAVYPTAHPGLVVKLLFDDHGRPLTDPTVRDWLSDRLEDVCTLPIPADLPLARPLALLAPPHVGFVMRLLDHMIPLETLSDHSGGSPVESYARTGGLRRRLALLAAVAQTLGRLHAASVVYADVSPRNVFVAADPSSDAAWLIDPDNLRFTSRVGARVHSPGFAAPEVVCGRAGVTPASDRYAFALLAFHTLTLSHAFLGRHAEAAGWDADVDRRQMAERGELPWVGDPGGLNPQVHGLPLDLALTPRMRELFAATFEAGRTDLSARPSLLSWSDVLAQAADAAALCGGCPSSYDSRSVTCPFCDTPRPRLLVADAYPFPFDGERPPSLGFKVVTAGRDAVLPGRLVRPSRVGDAGSDVRVVFERGRVRFKPDDDLPYILLRHDGRKCGDLSLAESELAQHAYLLCGREPQQRLLIIRPHGG